VRKLSNYRAEQKAQREKRQVEGKRNGLRAAGWEQPTLVLVGVVHGDPAGYEQLKRLLEQRRPRLISVEISEFSWRWRCHREARWQQLLQLAREALPPAERRHLALQRVAAQIALPFEVRAAADYAREHGVAWRAVDLKSVAREHLPRYETELLNPDNLRRLALTPDGDWGDYIRREYQRARRAWQAGRAGSLAGTTLPPETTLREKVLAHRVARLAREWGRLVHVGGWEHLIVSGRRITMADFLATWRPARVLLDESSGQF
jgi:hypothetical protein